MSWLALTIFAIIARATYSIATKMLSSRVEVSPITQSVLLTTTGGLLAVFMSPLIGGLKFAGLSDHKWAVMIMVLSQAFGNIVYFLGIKRLDAGTAQIGFSSILIWNVILSILFLDSSFNYVQSFGIVLMFTAILLVQYKEGVIRVFNTGIAYMIASAILFAVFQVSSADLASEISPAAYLVLAYLGSSTLIGGLYFKTLSKDWPKLKRQVSSTSQMTLFASSLSLLYFLFSFFAYRDSPNSGVVVMLLTAQVILSVIFGVIFLQERDNIVRKTAAAVLAFVASALIR